MAAKCASSRCSSAPSTLRRRRAVSRYVRRAVFPVEVAICRKLRESSTHIRPHSAATAAVTASMAAPLPVPTLPNRYRG